MWRESRERKREGNSFLHLFTNCEKYGSEERLEGEVFPIQLSSIKNRIYYTRR